jgi:hypothetical protein
MQRDRRNPYVILGVPFGASGEEARAGFARISRRLRQDDESPYSKEDLTWALHQVEQIITNPALAVEVYRIPASPSALTTSDVGVFSPAPHRLPRRTAPSSEEWEAVMRDAISRALRRELAIWISPKAEYV